MVERETVVMSPSDVQHGNFPEGELVMAGRLLGRDARTVWLADAYATVQLVGQLEGALGSLVKVRVAVTGSCLVLRKVLELHAPAGTSTFEQSRLIGRGVGSNLRARALAMSAVRSFFAARRFTEVETPVVVPSPGLDLHLDALQTVDGYLNTSPEYQMKRLLVGGMPRIFQIARVFRAGERGALHNPEFTMLEWYRAFADIDAVMGDTEALVAAVAETLTGAAEVVAAGVRVVLKPPFARIAVAQAFARFAGVAEPDALLLAEQSPDVFFRILVERVEPALAQLGAVFLVDYPIAQASLARAKPGEPRVCERFELYVGGVELCNGFGELTDPDEQRRRLVRDRHERARLGKPVYPIDERFVEALGEGLPPSSGNALGLDRLLALCLAEPTIARVMSFPDGVL